MGFRSSHARSRAEARARDEDAGAATRNARREDDRAGGDARAPRRRARREDEATGERAKIRADEYRAPSRRTRALERARTRGVKDGASDVDAPRLRAEDVWANCMEDESTRWRRTWLGRHAFEVDARYEPVKMIGRGAYGVVCAAIDAADGTSTVKRKVAVKKLTSCFDSLVEARRVLREVHLLRRLKHDNVIELLDVMMPTGEDGRVNDVYLVYELMDTDLHQIIRSDQALLEEHCQYFTYQILRGLKYVHSANVLHRDLKPSNILLNANCDLAICDFGLARSIVEEGRIMTSYVVTRWYRAPELLMNSEEYAAAIDMWSVGCILAEIIGRKPLFPGNDFIHQMQLIIDTLGSPEEADLDFISSEYARKYIASLPHRPKVDFATLYPHASACAIDLLERILVFDPRRRISVDEALAHPWLAGLHDPRAEPTFVHDARDANLAPLDEPDVRVPDDCLRDAMCAQMRAVRADAARTRARIR